jgi:hypothetical protein
VEGIHWLVNLTLFHLLIAAMILACGSAVAQQAVPPEPPPSESEVMTEGVPPEVVTSAVAAVARLGEEVVLGRYQVAVERMYPVWKERTAKRMGGMAALEKQLAGVGISMVQQGISIISCKPQGLPRAYEVAPGTKVVKEDGVNVGKLVFTKWLVLVPTVRKIRMMHGEPGQPPKIITIESISYQVAISDKGKNDWTFSDGSELKPNDLRGLFITLPQNLELPPVEKRQSR